MASGSWFGLPEFGLTEKVASKISGGKTTDLSNALSGSYKTPSSTSSPTGSTGSKTSSTTGGYTNPFASVITKPITTQNAQVTNASSSSMPSFEAPQVDYDAMYNPLIQNLSETEARLRGELPQAEADINKDSLTALESARQRNELTLQDVNNQRQIVDKRKSSALADAIRLWNAQGQKMISRFGGGSSAGQAVGEIAQSEFFRNQGRINDTFEGEQQKITDYATKAHLAYIDAQNQIESQTRTLIAQVKAKLSENLMQISSKKAEIESAKNERKMMALENAIEQARQIAVWKWQQELGLEVYKKQIQAQVEAQTKAVANAQYATPSNAFANDVTASGVKPISTNAPISSGLAYNRKPTNPEDDLNDAFLNLS